MPSGGRAWFCRSRIGVNKLKTFLPEISAESGLTDLHHTNHSLRATAVTRMYNTGVPEKLIAEKSAHRSLKALRLYERASEEQEIAAGKCIQVAGHMCKDASCTDGDKEHFTLEPIPSTSSGVSKPALQQLLYTDAMRLTPFSSVRGGNFNFSSDN